MKKKTNKAFTLIEMLLVILIIGVIVGIVLPRVGGMGESAKIKAAMADLRSIKSAIEVYYMNNSSYPATGSAALETALQGETNRILDELPDDVFAAAGTKYVYILNGAYYVVYSVGKSGTGAVTVAADAVTISGADPIWVSNCKTQNHGEGGAVPE